MHHTTSHTTHRTAHHTAHHLWQSDDASLKPDPKRCRVTIDDASTAASAAASAADVDAEREAVVVMKVKGIKAELIRLGGSTLGLLEKSEFVEALLAARKAARRHPAAASPPEVVISAPPVGRTAAALPTPPPPPEVISLDEGEQCAAAARAPPANAPFPVAQGPTVPPVLPRRRPTSAAAVAAASAPPPQPFSAAGSQPFLPPPHAQPPPHTQQRIDATGASAQAQAQAHALAHAHWARHQAAAISRHQAADIARHLGASRRIEAVQAQAASGKAVQAAHAYRAWPGGADAMLPPMALPYGYHPAMHAAHAGGGYPQPPAGYSPYGHHPPYGYHSSPQYAQPTEYYGQACSAHAQQPQPLGVRVREVDGVMLCSVDCGTRGEPALHVPEHLPHPRQISPHEMRMQHPSMGYAAASQHAAAAQHAAATQAAVDEASRAMSAWAQSNFPGQHAQVFVNGVAQQPPSAGASSLPSLPLGAPPQGPTPAAPFGRHCAHYAAAAYPPPAATVCHAAGR